MSEQQAEYITDAIEMLGAGYEHPALEVEPPSKVIRRRNGKMESVERPAFVKVSTAFKQEMPNISGDALKVWLYIALSINRHTGKANPGLRTIAVGVSLAVNTVQKCLQELEALGLLAVDRETRKYNIYEALEYVSANRSATVSNLDTDDETVSNPSETVSNSRQSVSSAVILNQINQSNQKIYIDPIVKKLSDSKFPINPNSAVIIQGWRDDFPEQDAVIIRAIDEAVSRSARSMTYVDRILVGWKANGVPPTREQQVEQAKKGKPTYANSGSPTTIKPVTEAQLDIARQVLAMRAGAD